MQQHIAKSKELIEKQNTFLLVSRISKILICMLLTLIVIKTEYSLSNIEMKQCIFQTDKVIPWII